MAARDLATRIACAAVGSIGAQRSARVNTVVPQRASVDNAPRSRPTQGFMARQKVIVISGFRLSRVQVGRNDIQSGLRVAVFRERHAFQLGQHI